MATCQICRYAGNPKDKPPCADCKGYSEYEYEKPQNNADRIRSMTDEELADYLHEEPWRCVIGKPCTKCERLVDGRCIPIAEWLRQPAENK